MITPVRRIVTGHDAEGNSIIQSAAPPTRIVDLSAVGPRFYEVWNTRESPAKIDRDGGEPSEERLTLAPPQGGTRIRVLDIPPESAELKGLSEAESRAHFELLNATQALRTREGAHPLMHRTESKDYAIVIEGEIYLIVDKGEFLCRPGDIVVQRGTNHAWSNRSGRNCRIAFVLIDGQFTDGL
jgi:hypothetical protein